jgi:hypothetical protein
VHSKRTPSAQTTRTMAGGRLLAGETQREKVKKRERETEGRKRREGSRGTAEAGRAGGQSWAKMKAKLERKLDNQEKKCWESIGSVSAKVTHRDSFMNGNQGLIYRLTIKLCTSSTCL